MLTLVLAGTGLLLALTGPPLWAGKVPPNPFYGFRVPRSIHDPRVWYPVNRVAGRDLTLAGVAMVAGSLGLWALGIPMVEEAGAIVGLLTVPPLVAVAHSMWWASAFVAELDRPGSVATPASKLAAEAAQRRAEGQQPPRTPEGP